MTDGTRQTPGPPPTRPWPLATLYALYFASRGFALGLLPGFLDESVHIRWSNLVAHGENIWRPWTDGKLLSIWLGALVVRFSSDELLACRGVTVATGALSVWACYELGRRLFSPAVGAVAALFYIACPFTLFYDRMALTDAPLLAFGGLVLLASVRLARGPTAAHAWMVALALTLAVLTKASGLLLAFVPALAALCLGADWKKLARALAIAYGLAAALLAYPLLIFFRITPQYQKSVLAEGQAVAMAGIAENALLCRRWLETYWTHPLMACFAIALVVLAIKRSREGLLLALTTLVPIAVLVAISSVWFPRYLLFTSLPFLILAAYGASWVAKSLASRAGGGEAAILLAVLGLVLMPALQLDSALWLDPAHAALPAVDRDQYVNGWTSGYGVRETADFLRAEAGRSGHVRVVTHALSKRTSLMALRLAFRDDPRIEIQESDLGDDANPELAPNPDSPPVFAVLSPKLDENRARPPAPDRWPHAVLVLSTFKPSGQLCNEVYRLSAR